MDMYLLHRRPTMTNDSFTSDQRIHARTASDCQNCRMGIAHIEMGFVQTVATLHELARNSQL